MEKRILDPHSYAYIFNELDPFITMVFVLIKPEAVYIIDTYCGSEYMAEIMADIENELKGKKLYVINTHFHWDHVWGNPYFEQTPIIAHYLCGTLMEESWETDLSEEGQHFKGEKRLVKPTVLIEDAGSWENEDIYIFHTPGHTRDGLSVLDKKSDFLYVGDNLERPIIQIYENNLDVYTDTLNKYVQMNPKQIHAGHSLAITLTEIEETIQYIDALKTGKPLELGDSFCQEIHESNQRYAAAEE
ncbi:MBL fold metallo-hydrolase [Enterococcus sp. LJL51]|uniref:MBL fold metallo-hydrolase n=1 Tax=Enterococcus sp. LJL51 TaxID=3416656 RepID=UPI003CEF7645